MTLPLNILITLRLLISSFTFILPGPTSAFFSYPLPASSNFAARLFASREAVLGGLLWSSKLPEARLGTALLAGIIADALDGVALVWGFLNGEVDDSTLAVFGGGVVIALGLAGWGWEHEEKRNRRIE